MCRKLRSAQLINKRLTDLIRDLEKEQKDERSQTMLEGRAIWYLIPALLISGAVGAGVAYRKLEGSKVGSAASLLEGASR
jgi:hypothetical protein